MMVSGTDDQSMVSFSHNVFYKKCEQYFFSLGIEKDHPDLRANYVCFVWHVFYEIVCFELGAM